MNAKLRFICVVLVLAPSVSGAALAQAPRAIADKRELIYCADRMTHEEREAYRARMRAARTIEEKVAVRAAHRSEMQTRAARQGAAEHCQPAGRQWRGGQGQ